MNNQKIHPRPVAVWMWRTFILIVLSALLLACGAPATQSVVGPQATAAPATEPPTSGLPVTKCDTLLPAEACDPEWQSRIQYVPLGNLLTSECGERFLESGTGICTVFTYNNNGQDFTITVEGADPVVVEEYITSSAVYFEAQQAGTTPPPDLGLPSLATILVDAAVEVASLPQAEMIIQRDKLSEEREANGEYTTFAEVLYVLTNDDGIPDKVLEVATVRASQIYAERGVDGSQIPEELKILMYEPGAPFLIDPAALPQDDTAYHDILLNNTFGLAVTLDWVSVPKEPDANLWVVWYAIDPVLSPNNNATPVGVWAYVYYKEKCNVYSASSRISATSGSMTNTFWRQTPYLFVGSRSASIQGVASPTGLSHNSYPGIGKYDTYVRGGSQGGQYFIYGGWVQGSGCQ
jgi:hypothetical protein